MTDPKMLFTQNGFYCSRCDYYFNPELDRSGLPDRQIRWSTVHRKVERFPFDCPLVGRKFEIGVMEFFPAAREVEAK